MNTKHSLNDNNNNSKVILDGHALDLRKAILKDIPKGKTNNIMCKARFFFSKYVSGFTQFSRINTMRINMRKKFNVINS